MFARLAVFLLLAAPLLAGCITPAGTDVAPASVLDGLLAPATSMWFDPQNAPHPAYNYPTLTHVPDSATLPAFWKPIPARALPAPITGLELVASAGDTVISGAGIALFGSIAVVPGFGEVSKVVDISDPTKPKVLSEMASELGAHRGAVIIAYPDGRLVTAMSAGYGFDVWDITNPAEPVNLGQVEGMRGHKIGVVPGTPIIYNANSRGGAGGDTPVSNRLAQTGGGQTEIFDLSDPANPVWVQNFTNGFGCHHIFFWNDASQEKYRAICAGIEYTQIWDVADPLNPEVIVNVPVHHGIAGTPSASASSAAFSHFAILNTAGDVLVVGDEMGGGGTPPGCDVRVETPVGRQVSGPLGNLWFYDVSDEKNPRLQGWIGMDTILPNTTSCTAHHGRIVPDEGRDLLAMSFYGQGVALIDFTDPMDSRVIDQFADGSDTWETWYYNGYLFTGDLARGMDVFTFR